MVTVNIVKGQDVHFSQFYSNPLYMNPAYAGSVVCPRITTNFRLQWPSIDGKYLSYSASYDQHFNAIAGGIGVLFVGDRAGTGQINTNMFSIMYSFKADLTRKVAMRLAAQVTCQQKTLDFSKCSFADMVDPRSGFIYSTKENLPHKTKVIADFAAGIAFYSEQFYGGVAVHHFTQPRESFFDLTGKEVRLPMKITGNFGAMLKLKQSMRSEKSMGDMYLSPNLILQYQNNFSGGYQYMTANVGMYFSCYPMVLGAWYRLGYKNSDALIFLAGVEYEWFKIGYSYDVTLPSNKYSKPNTGGSHEVSMQFHLPCPVKSRRIRHINCPKF
jgi:type IX secretion system PorP/SprF family membrane protein